MLPSCGQEGQVGTLAGCPDDNIGILDLFCAGHFVNQDAAFLVVALVIRLDGLHAFDLAIFDDDFLEHLGIADLDALFLGQVHFPLVTGHLAARLAADHLDFRGSEPHQRAQAVERHIPCAQDSDLFTFQIQGFLAYDGHFLAV